MSELLPSQEKIWLKYYSDEALNTVIPKKTLYEYLSESCEEHRNLTALNYYGTTISYWLLLKKIDEYADKFASLGIKKNEKVSFLTVALPETFYAFYALNKIGAIPVLIEPRMSVERIKNFIDMSESRFVIVIDSAYPKIKDTVENSKTIEKVIIQSAFDSLPTLKRTIKKISDRKPYIPTGKRFIKIKDFEKIFVTVKAEKCGYTEGSVCAITQTGGSTGIPKGVLQTNLGLNSAVQSMKYSGSKCKPGDRFLDIMPVFTSYGLVCGLHAPLILGFEDVLIPDFSLDKFPALMIKYKPNITIAVPTFYEKLMNDKKLSGMDLSFITHLISGGDVMNLALEDKLCKFLKDHNAPNPISQGFGMSETSAACTFSFTEYKRGSAGIPALHSDLGIFAPNSTAEFGYGVEGEICVSGPTIMGGYFNNVEENKRILRVHPDGKTWVHSGDMGYLDEDGFLFFKGRIKHVIPRFDGHKNYPVQIENVVATHSAVKNCAVIGVKDREHIQGLLPLIVIQKYPEIVESDAALRQEILDLCQNKIEERGQPCDVVFIDEMPITLMGKNDVRKLEEIYRDYNYLSQS